MSTTFRAVILFMVLIGCALFISAARAQQASTIAQAGTSTPGSYQPNGIDTINLQNGALILDIPIVSYPQRGDKLKFSFSLKYSPIFWYYSTGAPVLNSSGVETYTGVWGDPTAGLPTPVGVTLLRDQALAETTVELDYPCSQFGGPGCPPPQNESQVVEEKVTANLSSLITADGAVHNFGLNGNHGDYSFLPTMDGSNFVPVSNGSQTPTVFLGSNGVKYSLVKYDSSHGLTAFNQADPDSNTITVSSAGWTDTIGRLIPGSINGPGSGHTSLNTVGEPYPGVVTTDLTKCSTGTTAARIWSIPGPSGNTSTYVLCFTPYSAQTAFATTNSQPTGNAIYYTQNGGQASGNYLLLTQFVLPDDTSYRFTYDSWLELTSIRLPSGGSISYGWVTRAWLGVEIPYQQTRVVNTRTVHNTDGTSHTWTYGLSETAGHYSPTMIITDPNMNDEEHDLSYASVPSSQYQDDNTSDFNRVETINNYSGTGSARTLLRTTTLVREQRRNRIIYPPSPRWSAGMTLITGPLLSKTVTFVDTKQVSQTIYSITPSIGTYTYYNFNENTGLALGVHAFAAQSCTTCWSTFQPQSVSEYDYGSGQPGSLLRTTNTTYKWNDGSSTAASYLAANILDIPSKVTATGGGITSETDYSYDETSYSLGGTRGHLTTVSRVNSNGASPSSHIQVNSNGMTSSTVDPLGNTVTITYDSTGLFPNKVQSPTTNGVAHVDYYSYDANTGSLNWHTDQNGTGPNDPNHTTSYAYDDMGRVTSASYPDGGKSTLCYTDEGGSLCTQSAAPFSAYSSTVASPDPSQNGHTQYDGFGRQVQSTLPNGATSETTYDPLGRVASTSSPHFTTLDGYTTYAYDALGRLQYKCNADNGTGAGSCVPGTSYQQWSYSGNVTKLRDENGNQWSLTSDALGRLTSVLEPNGTSSAPTMETDYSYDALNNLRSVTQWGGASGTTGARTRSFTYDSLSRLVQVFNPETGWLCYGTTTSNTAPTGSNCTEGYDANGNLLAKTDARGVTINYSYDGLNRLRGKSYTVPNSAPAGYAPTSPVSYGYDQTTANGQTLSNTIGRRSSMTDNTGTEAGWSTFSYDPVGRVAKEVKLIHGQSGWSNRVYNLNGSVDSAYLFTSWKAFYNYNGAGSATTASWQKGTSLYYPFVSNATYTAAGQLASMRIGDVAAVGPVDGLTAPAVINVTKGYNNRQQPTLVSASATASGSNPTRTLVSLSYCYSNCPGGQTTTRNNGNILQVANNVHSDWSRNYTYDTLNRIATSSTSSGTESYVYDSFGNRYPDGFTAASLPWTFTSQNQVPAGSGLIYDAAGNVIQDSASDPTMTHRFAYDGEGRLATVDGSATYIYDADGNRVTRLGTADGGTIYWPWVDGTVTDESNLNGSIRWRNLYFNGQIAVRQYTSTEYILPDHLGSTRVVLSPSGTIKDDIDYSPFGKTTPASTITSDDRRVFTGKERDTESGNDYFGYRYYSSSMGRWMSPDPTGLDYADLTNPQSFNLYSYVLNNPLKFSDPNGLYCAWDDGTSDDDPLDGGATVQQCNDQGGYWTDQSNPCGGADNCVATFYWNQPELVEVFAQVDTRTLMLQYLRSCEGSAPGGGFGAYNDSLGNCTAGYGQLLHPHPCTAQDYAAHRGETQGQAEAQLEADYDQANQFVQSNAPDSTQGQRDAFVDQAFNMGVGTPGGAHGMVNHDAWRDFTSGNNAAVPRDIMSLTHGGSGIRTRRANEVNMFTNGTYPATCY